MLGLFFAFLIIALWPDFGEPKIFARVVAVGMVLIISVLYSIREEIKRQK